MNPPDGPSGLIMTPHPAPQDGASHGSHITLNTMINLILDIKLSPEVLGKPTPDMMGATCT